MTCKRNHFGTKSNIENSKRALQSGVLFSSSVCSTKFYYLKSVEKNVEIRLIYIAI